MNASIKSRWSSMICTEFITLNASNKSNWSLMKMCAEFVALKCLEQITLALDDNWRQFYFKLADLTEKKNMRARHNRLNNIT